MHTSLTSEFLKRNCPSCGTAQQANAIMQSVPQAESLSFEEIKSYWSGFFKDKIFFSYHRCRCGLMYCPSFFTEAQLEHLYASMSDNTAGVSLEPLIKTQEKYFSLLTRFGHRQGNYLELGPDIGLFTEQAVKKGMFDTYWLFEPNQKIWPDLEKKMLNKKYHLFSTIDALDHIPDKSLSTIIMIHVLDHLLNPIEILHALKNKLAPDALLFFVTHDEQSLLAKITRSQWPAFCLQHPHLFNPHSIASLLHEAGFKVMQCEKVYNYFPVTYLIKHALFLLGIKNIRLPALNSLRVGLKLGNIATIARL